MNKTKVKSWIDLEVLNKAHHLVLEIYKITKDFPHEAHGPLKKSNTSLETINAPV